ncbi:hypothetical protein KIN20_036733 [Parelaphostrongylus tenuis]|uniref:Uncharacterized protein n=1 Tax=Parelaphostrongylus tenuis TaxID=148309 RepID=A0AAD5RCZ0_PARTN|nr:hypothetical protein KIN20_036733 [Parelaphostrongylus tenuis]
MRVILHCNILMGNVSRTGWVKLIPSYVEKKHKMFSKLYPNQIAQFDNTLLWKSKTPSVLMQTTHMSETHSILLNFAETYRDTAQHKPF